MLQAISKRCRQNQEQQIRLGTSNLRASFGQKSQMFTELITSFNSATASADQPPRKMHRLTQEKLPTYFFTEEEITDFLEGLIDVCADLQKFGIAHRNLKPQNIILNRDNSFRDLRLINFELGVIANQREVEIQQQGLKQFEKQIKPSPLPSTRSSKTPSSHPRRS